MRLLVSAGETSGDRLGGALIAELRKLDAGLDCFGMGGERMAAAGMRRLVDSHDVAVVGLVEVVRYLPRIVRARRTLIEQARRERPRGAVLVDFPDFHFSLGRALARIGIPVVYYVSPQVWAWRRGRVRAMKKFVRRVVTLFPFEVPIYREAGVDAVCGGHPLADEVRRHLAEEERPRRGEAPRVVLMPGSRPDEVRRHWPVLRDAVQRLRADRPVEALAVPAPGIPEEAYPGAAAAGIALFRGNPDGLLAESDLLLTASGTATLEGALCGAPMVVIYKTSALTFALARRLVSVEHVALANIVAGGRVAPELLQGEATAPRVAAEAARILDDPAEGRRMKEAWRGLWERLGPRDAAAHAASAVAAALAA